MGAFTDMAQKAEILDQVFHWPPVDTAFVAGRWHRDRYTAEGFAVEAKVHLKALMTRQAGAPKKFLVIARARSGTTLLKDLLNANPAVQCDGEVLHRGKLAPLAFLKAMARKSSAQAYGAKFLSYQMVQVQRLRDPVGFLRAAHADGFKLIHLTRDTFGQAMSLSRSHMKQQYHSSGGAKHSEAIELPTDWFVRRLEWNDMLLRYETACLESLPHLRLSYDADLQEAAHQQGAASRVFDYIGVPDAPVSTTLNKILPADPRAVLANYDDLADAVRMAGLGHLLPDL
ncbi:MAG: hypothetical protein AAFR34_02085 [Pseudomonadota bacterium]